MRYGRFGPAVAAAALAALAASPAQAWNSFCEDEPPVTLVTPAGEHVTINNYVSYAVADRRLARQIEFSGWAEAAGPDATLITIRVVTPAGGHGTVAVVSGSKRYDDRASATVAWNSEATLQLVIPNTHSRNS